MKSQPDLEPNGLGVDEGLGKIVAALPQQTREERLAYGRSAVHYLNSLGITAWLDARADMGSLTAYRDLSQRGELTAHVAAFPEVKATKDMTGDPLAKVKTLRSQFSDVANLTIPGVKIFADGVVEYPSQTAASVRALQEQLATVRRVVIRSRHLRPCGYGR